MNLAQSAAQYKKNQIETALPEELTMMLFDGAVKFITESCNALEKNQIEQSHIYNIKTQKIIREFINTLDLKYQIAQDLLVLYDFILTKLIEANIKKDLNLLNDLKFMITELRDTWKQAMPKMRQPVACNQ